MWRAAIPLAFAAGCAAAGAPELPAEHTAVIQMRMPYIPLTMPLRVVTSASAQKIEYYDGLQVDMHSKEGTFRYTFNNSRRVCLFTPPAAGPKGELRLGAEDWASPFLPDLSKYTRVGDELVGGVMCQKFVLDAHHGSLGTMDDHLSFYWDAVLQKPVRWHMHSRHVTFGSHTDEYIMDFLSFQAGAPSEADLRLPEGCEKPQRAEVSIQIHDFLARAAHVASEAAGAAEPLFDAFARQQGRAYAPEERAVRRSVFARNVQLVERLNRRHAGRASFRGNRFLDATRDEIMSFRGGRNRGPSRARRTAEHWSHVRSHELLGSAPLPKSFDWRAARPGSVSPVKDQAMCGSCWAYGLTEPIESILAIRSGGQLVELPEQFAVDCLWTESINGSQSNNGCDGGDSDIGALEILRKFGGVIPTAAAYGSYLSVNGFCKDVRLMGVGAKITGWVDVVKRDEQGLLQALVSQGPISVGIQVPDEMLFYDSGVLSVQSCKYNEAEIDHAVVLTGFGTDEHGTDYYVIRNSWSTYWGDAGYIKIARGELDCCVACEAGYPRLEASGEAAVVV